MKKPAKHVGLVAEKEGVYIVRRLNVANYLFVRHVYAVPTKDSAAPGNERELASNDDPRLLQAAALEARVEGLLYQA